MQELSNDVVQTKSHMIAGLCKSFQVMDCKSWLLNNFRNLGDFFGCFSTNWQTNKQKTDRLIDKHTFIWSKAPKSIRMVWGTRHFAEKTMAVCKSICLSVCHCSRLLVFDDAKLYRRGRWTVYISNVFKSNKVFTSVQLWNRVWLVRIITTKITDAQLKPLMGRTENTSSIFI